MSDRLSIVIRCYNEETYLGRLLDGIAQQTVRHPEIILVDSGSTDRTREIAVAYPVKIITIPPEEFSFGRSLNLGCREATGDIIVIASAHVYPVYRDWLSCLLAPLQDPQIALSYGKQRGNEITKYAERQIFAKWFPEQSNLHQTVPFCNNANAAIRRSLWVQFPYNETLTGLEDIDWAKRVIQAGYRIAYTADAEIIHVHDESPQRIYNRYRREAMALKQIFPQERFQIGDFLRLLATNLVSDYFHAYRDRCLWKNVQAIPLFRCMQFWGTYRGFQQRAPLTSAMKQAFYYPRSLNGDRDIHSAIRPQRKVDYSQGYSETNP